MRSSCSRWAAMLLVAAAAVAVAAAVQPEDALQQHHVVHHRMQPRAGGRSLLAQSLTCDGKVHELSMPDGPYPESIPFAPIVNQPFFACSRPKAGLDAESNGECGASPRYECERHLFEPVLFGSGQTPGIISPNNPVTISLKPDADFFLTYLEWTAVDVGSAGARLRGLYDAAKSDLSPVTNNYAWTWNGRNPDGEFGPCSSCAPGQGIKVMNVSAIPGAGFRSMQLSQMFVNTQCAGASGGLNYDALYFWGMKYACVRPTCGDTDLNTADAQRFGGCMPSTAYAYNPKAKDNTILSVESCCLPVTCDNTSPVKQPGQAFDCGPHREFDSTKASTRGPSIQNCCSKAATCDDISPLSAPGVRFQCADDTHEWDPAAAKTTPPTHKACCQPRTCSNANPVSSPGERFECPGQSEYNEGADDATNPDVQTCCKPATCANVTPVSKPGVAWSCSKHRELDPAKAAAEAPSDDRCCSKVATCANVSPVRKPGTEFDCPQDTEFDPARGSTQQPSTDKCCKPATCASVSPVGKPGRAFECPPHTEFLPAAAETHPPRAQSCCKAATCDDTKPASKPGSRFECPRNTEFRPEQAKTHPPTLGACCKVATCGDVSPVAAPGRRFSCPKGMEFNPRAILIASPSAAACCVAATCENITPVSKPGVRYSCPGNRQFDPEKLRNIMPSEEACCSQPNTCEDLTPLTEPGVPFSCPRHREFDPAKAEATWPSEERCCSKVATCGDTHPITAPGSRWVCPKDFEYNPASSNITQPDEAKCCVRATCGNMAPVSRPGALRMVCPELTEFDPNRTAVHPPRPGSCCRAATCADMQPISKARLQAFVCPADREFQPASANATRPSVEACCSKAATCADTKPVTKPNTAFVCPADREFNPRRAGASPVNVDSCCSKPFTCGAVKPFSAPGRTFNCGPFRELDPARNTTEKPSEAACCSKPRTCGDFLPVSKPRSAYPCSNASQFNPSMADAWPATESTCCKARTCADFQPVSSPGSERFPCPAKHTEYDASRDSATSPSEDVCCKHATCADVTPLSKPGVSFVCPSDMHFNKEAAGSRGPSVETCCQAVVDVWIKKSVSPSSVQKAGSILLYRLEVGVSSSSSASSSRPAETVTLVQAMPAGMQLVSVVEQPNEDACNNDEAGLTCIWAAIAPGKQRFITITANATTAGVQPSLAAVTTASLDTDAKNNKAGASVTVLGACCTPGPEGGDHCVESLPEACTGGFLPQSVCSQVNICSVAPSPGQQQQQEENAAAAAAAVAAAPGDAEEGEDAEGDAQAEQLAAPAPQGNLTELEEALSALAASSQEPEGDTQKPEQSKEQSPEATAGHDAKQPEQQASLASVMVPLDNGSEQEEADKAEEADDKDEEGDPDAALEGACCNPLTGACADGVSEAYCAPPAKWTRGATCRAGGVCTGACCGDGGKCSQKLKQDCSSSWFLYGQCKADSCPKPSGYAQGHGDEAPTCIAKWQQCKVGKPGSKQGRSLLSSLFGASVGHHHVVHDDAKHKHKRREGKHAQGGQHGGSGADAQCCEGTTCQWTYDGCRAGSFVCKPVGKCVHEDSPCGGAEAGACCKGLTCVREDSSKPGVCKRVSRCTKDGGECAADTQCCRGSRCKDGQCTASVCYKRCTDYACFLERKKDCEALAAAAASA